MAEMHLSDLLVLDRCPHCGVSRPNLGPVTNPFQTWDHQGSNERHWRAYRCSGCGGVVIAAARASRGSALIVHEHYPSSPSIDSAIPEPAKRYLAQAISSLSAPDGAVMLAASSVDAMLKEKGLREGTLNSRIKQAVNKHVITPDMELWAHQIRLDANDPRHADAKNPHHDEASAKRVVDFAQALAQFLFVIPSRVTRGIKDAGGTPPSEQ